MLLMMVIDFQAPQETLWVFQKYTLRDLERPLRQMVGHAAAAAVMTIEGMHKMVVADCHSVAGSYFHSMKKLLNLFFPAICSTRHSWYHQLRYVVATPLQSLTMFLLHYQQQRLPTRLMRASLTPLLPERVAADRDRMQHHFHFLEQHMV